MYIKKILPILVLFLAPFSAFAVGEPLIAFSSTVARIIAALIPIVSLIAVLYFFWGLAKYVLSAGDPEKAAEGKSIMIWGVLAMFVLVSIWGIIGFIQQTVGADQGAIAKPIVLPTIDPGIGVSPF